MVKEDKGKTLTQIKAKVAEADKEDVIETAEQMDSKPKSNKGVGIAIAIGVIVLGLGALEKVPPLMVVGGIILAISVAKLIMGGK